MGWPFGAKKAPYDPSAPRPVQDRPWDRPLDFLQLAANEGGRQLAGAAARVAPDSWGLDPMLGEIADGAAAANNGVIMDRLKRAGVPLQEMARMNPADFDVRKSTFRQGSPYNPQAGGVEAWRARSGERARDWNLEADAMGLAQLGAPDAPIHPTQPALADSGGLFFGRRRR